MFVKMKKLLPIFGFIFILVSGCLRKPIQYPEHEKYSISVNSQIKDLLTVIPGQGKPVILDSDRTLFLRVSADDASGNFYEQLILEDSTGGINLLINMAGLFKRFPMGSGVYLKTDGLYLGNNHGSLQVGGPPAPDSKGLMQVSKLSSLQLDRILFPATQGLALPDLNVSIQELNMKAMQFCNRLVTLSDVEWEDPMRDEKFGSDLSAVNTIIQDCTGAKLSVRTSNYAVFRGEPIPWGCGKVRGIFGVYDDEGQIQIRNTGDMQMTINRCDGSPPVNPQEISMGELRNMYLGRDTTLPAVYLHAVVTSDESHGNFGSGNLVLQQGQKGITIFFGSSVSGLPHLGDSVRIYLGGAKLTNYNGVLEIKNISLSKVKQLATDRLIKPITLTIAELNARFADLESVLVKIEYARVASGGKYSGNKTLSDGSGNIILYTSSYASFANDPIPSITKTYQGIVTPYGSTKEIKIRYPEIDVY
jgi:hypothetical protein